MDAICRVKRIRLFKCKAWQDFSYHIFDFGPQGKWFDVEHTTAGGEDRMRCEAYGYGVLGSGESYGSGAIYLRKGCTDWWT